MVNRFLSFLALVAFAAPVWATAKPAEGDPQAPAAPVSSAAIVTDQQAERALNQEEKDATAPPPQGSSALADHPDKPATRPSAEILPH